MEARRLYNGISKEQKEKLPTTYCTAEKISIKNENEISQTKTESTSSTSPLRNHKVKEN